MMDIRFIPEWEETEYVMVALPNEETDWAYILGRAMDQYRRLLTALLEAGLKVVVLCRDPEEPERLLGGDWKRFREQVLPAVVPYNDTWTRDYGPLSAVRGDRLRLLDFGFNGWGLKFASDRDNLATARMNQAGMFGKGTYRKELDYVLEGGSVETDGCGTILTTTRCLTSPNRNGGRTKQEVNRILEERLGADHVLWLDHGALEGDDTDSHIDTLARLAPDNTIIFTGCRNIDDPQFEELLRMRAQLTMFRNREGEPYNLIELPLPDPVYGTEGERLPATYANYLVANQTILMPVYGQPANDDLACKTIRIAYPNHKVVPVNCLTLLEQHGSLHCATMQLPPGALRI